MDLSTTYLGLELSSPLVASASPLSHTVDGVRRLADAGVGAVVLHSLFEEELERQAERRARLVAAGSESVAESRSYFPAVAAEDGGPVRYLDLVERSAAAVEVPVIGSLNGTTPDGWTGFARQMEEAGAAAIELNLYSAPEPQRAARQVEEEHVETLSLVRAHVGVPVAVKMSPTYSSIGEMARRFAGAGADGLVLFNRLLHPRIDPESLAVVPGVGLSTRADGDVPRTWIAVLRGSVAASLAASGGVEDADDVVAHLLAGADVVMTASALLRHGPGHAAVLLDGLATWMARRGFHSPGEMRGLLAAAPDGDGTALGRADYVGALRAANAEVHGPW